MGFWYSVILLSIHFFTFQLSLNSSTFILDFSSTYSGTMLFNYVLMNLALFRFPQGLSSDEPLTTETILVLSEVLSSSKEIPFQLWAVTTQPNHVQYKLGQENDLYLICASSCFPLHIVCFEVLVIQFLALQVHLLLLQNVETLYV